MKYNNGDEYNGEWNKGRQEGRGNVLRGKVGVYKYANGDEYNGQWENNKKNGNGK